MKRDNEYLRTLLFEMEKPVWDGFTVNYFAQVNEEDMKRTGHFKLLDDAGLICKMSERRFATADIPEMPEEGGRPIIMQTTYRLTNDGHDFLEAVRDDRIWGKTVKVINSASGATLGMITRIAVEYGKRALEEKTGWPIP